MLDPCSPCLLPLSFAETIFLVHRDSQGLREGGSKGKG